MSADPPEGVTTPVGASDPTGVDDSFFVVGIGASAGGLEAVSALLRRTTVDGAAFVVVQHLAPNQSSMLTELLGRASILAVETVVDGVVIKKNHVYVTPPNAVLVLEGQTIRLVAPTPGTRPEMPIDAFFRSLADNRGLKAMGVVMSGTGTDGTFGLGAIKAAGGITFAQDLASSKFDGMPRSAQESGSADFCLTPEGIADEILRVSTHPYLQHTAVPQFRENLGALAMLLKSAFGIDLAHYKPKTIERRIQRRMAVHRIERFDQYLRLCQTDPKELSDLHKDLLINVTSFFRDKEPFEILRRDILPGLIAGKGGRATRCGSGCRAARRARRRTRSRCACSRCSTPRASTSPSRSSARTSTPMRSSKLVAGSTPRTSRPTSRSSGCAASSSRARTGTTRSSAACATWWCSRRRTSAAIRRSRSST
jgi:two-component system CheB/CheR fusion protein